MADRDTFEKMVDEYRSNYVQFLTTGNEAYKTAYKNAQDAVEKMINARQQQVESEKKDMMAFVQSYKEGNDEMGEEYDRATELRQNAQKIEDKYQASKNRYDLYMENMPNIPTIDISNGYGMVLRLGIILFLIPILFLIGFWSPQLTHGMLGNLPFMRTSPQLPFEFTVKSPALGAQAVRSPWW
jgi:hypothetical protein